MLRPVLAWRAAVMSMPTANALAVSWLIVPMAIVAFVWIFRMLLGSLWGSLDYRGLSLGGWGMATSDGARLAE